MNTTTNTDRAARIARLVRYMGKTEAEAASIVDAEDVRRAGVAQAARSSKQRERSRFRKADGRFESYGRCTCCGGALGVDYYSRTVDGAQVQCCERCAD